ncbi:histidine triad domain protein [Gammaproteobacteria bacterium]|nr:histidine triad domain protein [Gammaproteobacteria bacterium]
MNYQLDPILAANTRHVTSLTLCEVRIQNEARFPWVILIPKMDNIIEIIDLSDENQLQLMREIAQVSKAMNIVFDSDKLNIATLGNIVKQLHFHVIARYEADLAWPNPVWGFFEQTASYGADALSRRILTLKTHLIN